MPTAAAHLARAARLNLNPDAYPRRVPGWVAERIEQFAARCARLGGLDAVDSYNEGVRRYRETGEVPRSDAEFFAAEGVA